MYRRVSRYAAPIFESSQETLAPTPPKEMEVFRTSNACKGDAHRLRLGKNGSKWLWAIHANPPLRASTRPTVAAALELWLHQYGAEISEESRSQAASLLQDWKNYQGPGPEWTDRRKRGLSQPPLPREKRVPAAPECPPTSQTKHKPYAVRVAPRARPAAEDRKDPPLRRPFRIPHPAPGAPHSRLGLYPPHRTTRVRLPVGHQIFPMSRLKARPMQVAGHMGSRCQNDYYGTTHSQGIRRSLAGHLFGHPGKPSPT